MLKGSIVSCFKRDRVLLAGKSDNLWELNSQRGSIGDTHRVHKSLVNLIVTSLYFEQIELSFLPHTNLDDVSDSISDQLLQLNYHPTFLEKKGGVDE